MDSRQENTDSSIILRRQELIQRMASELTILVKKTVLLQTELSAEILGDIGADTRKALQSLDSVTQCLECLCAAVLEVSRAPDQPDYIMISDQFSGVFLDDVKKRLLSERNTNDTSISNISGELDIL